MLSTVANASALWGGSGAFIYGAPRLIACVVACREAGTPSWVCSANFLIVLLTGAIAAAAFSAVVLNLAHMKDANAISAMIGLLANPVAPRLVNGLSGVITNALSSKLGKALSGDDK